MIQLFGISPEQVETNDDDDESICLNDSFEDPDGLNGKYDTIIRYHFFLKAPKLGWKKSYCKKIKKFLQNKIGYRYPNNPYSVDEFKKELISTILPIIYNKHLLG